jgi:hypothetical protein
VSEWVRESKIYWGKKCVCACVRDRLMSHVTLLFVILLKGFFLCERVRVRVRFADQIFGQISPHSLCLFLSISIKCEFYLYCNEDEEWERGKFTLPHSLYHFIIITTSCGHHIKLSFFYIILQFHVKKSHKNDVVKWILGQAQNATSN